MDDCLGQSDARNLEIEAAQGGQKMSKPVVTVIACSSVSVIRPMLAIVRLLSIRSNPLR